jgi:hypothetical protein
MDGSAYRMTGVKRKYFTAKSILLAGPGWLVQNRQP